MHELPSRTPFDRVRSQAALRAAWRRVQGAAARSISASTRGEAQRFEPHAERHLRRIADQLQGGRFVFAPSRGVVKDRPGKRARPIVVAPIESRIVERAMLDVLLEIPAVRDACCEAPTSFGGLRGRGVKDAIEAAITAARGGAAWCLRSDVAEFFRAIPRRAALSEIDRRVGDARFSALLDDATRTELENLAALGEGAALFPDDDLGVAQGGSLSTLLGNVVLRDFDAKLNGRGITCLRYVDDFVLLGAEAAHVRKAFASAQAELGRHGLRAYDPEREPDKASFGPTTSGFELLGCEIRGDRAMPSRRRRADLIARIEAILAESERWMERPGSGGARLGLAPTLERVSAAIAGFRSSYAFCAADDVMRSLDGAIDARIERYFRVYRRRIASQPARRAALRGVACLAAP